MELLFAVCFVASGIGRITMAEDGKERNGGDTKQAIQFKSIETERIEKEMHRLREENERLKTILKGGQADQQRNAARLDELRNIQQEKERMERQMARMDLDRKAQYQNYQKRLAALQRDKQNLEQMLGERDRDTELQNELDRVSREKDRLEQELQRYEQVEQSRRVQQEELDRLLAEKESLLAKLRQRSPDGVPTTPIISQ